MSALPLVRVEVGGSFVDFTDYIVVSVNPIRREFHFRKLFDKSDTRLRELVAPASAASEEFPITLTVFADPDGMKPVMRLVGEARYSIQVNPPSRPYALIEDVYGEVDVEFL